MKKLVLAALGFGLVLAACNKDNKNTEISEDNDKADLIFTDVFNVTSNEVSSAEDNAFDGKNNQFAGLAVHDSCANVTWSLSADSTYLDTIVVDYGDNSSCETNGRVRRGKLNIYLSGRFREVGNSYTVVPEDFYVDDYKVEGSKTITNLGLIDGTLHWQYSVDVEDGVITTPDNETIQWVSSRTHTWRIFQGEFVIEGTASGVSRNGTSYNMAVTNPLILGWGCRWIKEGTIDLTPEGLDTRTVDYGDGDCDAQATVTINDNTYNITLW